MDNISREAAIEAVLNIRRAAAANFAPEFSGNQGDAYDRAVLDIHKALSALPAVEGWLAIEQYDGPPDGMVWGYLPDAPEYRRYATVRFKEGKIWTVGSIFHFDSDPVTHYMPLPAPPIE